MHNSVRIRSLAIDIHIGSYYTTERSPAHFVKVYKNVEENSNRFQMKIISLIVDISFDLSPPY